VLVVADDEASVASLDGLFTAQREAEWGEFVGDCGKYEAELAGEVAKGKLTLAELDEEEQSLDRLRRWYRAIRARNLFGAPSAAVVGAAPAGTVPGRPPGRLLTPSRCSPCPPRIRRPLSCPGSSA
jgi:hypothetical protein